MQEAQPQLNSYLLKKKNKKMTKRYDVNKKKYGKCYFK